MTPIGALVGQRRPDRLDQRVLDAAGRPGRSSSPRCRRTECGGVSAGAMVGSSRAAKSITAPGTRKPATSSSSTASGMPQVVQALGPGTGRPRGGRLSKITEHGDRAGAGPAADRAQHHRRQVLGLVENHVTEARGPAEQVRGLVDQDHVGERPSGGTDRSGRPRHHDQLLLLGGQDAAGRGFQELGVGQQSQDQLRRLQRRPERGRVRLDRLAAGHRVLDPVVGGVAGGFHPQQHLVRESVREHRPAGLVPDTAVLQFHDHLVGEVATDPPLVGAAWHHERRRGSTRDGPRRRAAALRPSGGRP